MVNVGKYNIHGSYGHNDTNDKLDALILVDVVWGVRLLFLVKVH